MSHSLRATAHSKHAAVGAGGKAWKKEDEEGRRNKMKNACKKGVFVSGMQFGFWRNSKSLSCSI